MRVIPTSELSDLIALFVTLMIFFSIDAKHRFSRNSTAQRAKRFFEVVTVIGGIFTVIAAIMCWIGFFLPENYFVHLLAILIPGSIAFVMALTLCIEVLFLRSGVPMKARIKMRPTAEDSIR